MSPNIATLYTFQIKCWSICSLKFVINLSEVYILKIYIISRFIISGKRINSMCEEYHTHLKKCQCIKYFRDIFSECWQMRRVRKDKSVDVHIIFKCKNRKSKFIFYCCFSGGDIIINIIIIKKFYADFLATVLVNIFKEPYVWLSMEDTKYMYAMVLLIL